PDVGGRHGCGAPCFGEDNEYVYREILGLSTREMAALHEAGAIESTESPPLRVALPGPPSRPALPGAGPNPDARFAGTRPPSLGGKGGALVALDLSPQVAAS